MATRPTPISVAVEGPVDEAVARRIIFEIGGSPGLTYGRLGKANLRDRIEGFNHAAARSPWFVLVDLNHEECAPVLYGTWLPRPAAKMCLRVAIREVESWLLADREEIARFLGVAVARITRDPESLDDPKQTLVDVARRSRLRAIREDLVPRPGSGREVGPAYTARMAEYVASTWRPEIAAGAAASLRRCLERVSALVDGP